MIDVQGPLRTAYYQLLNGNLTFNGVDVPVSDSVEKLEKTTNTYVLLKGQTGSMQNNHNAWYTEEIMQIDVITRGQRVSKLTVDNIGSQILGLLFPSPSGLSGLNQYLGIRIINARPTLNKDFEFTTTGGINVARKLIEVTQLVSQ